MIILNYYLFFQLAKNLSFDSLATLFGISDRLAKDIFWSCVAMTLESNIAIPDILDENTNLETVLNDLYESLDPFYQTLYGGLQDPSGNFYKNKDKNMHISKALKWQNKQTLTLLGGHN